MADLPNIEKGRIVIEGATGTDMVVNEDGSINVQSSSEQESLDDKLYGITDEITPSSANEEAVILIKNPSGSGLNLFLREFFVSALAPDFSTIIRIYANPTITTDGTTLAITNFRIGSVATSGMTAFTFPTVSANGTILLISSILKAITAESLKDVGFSRVLEPNNNLLLTLENSATNRDAAITLSWKEEDE